MSHYPSLYAKLILWWIMKPSLYPSFQQCELHPNMFRKEQNFKKIRWMFNNNHLSDCVLYREAGRMDYLCTVGTLHQSEGRVSSFLLIGLLADLTHCRERKARLEWTEKKLQKWQVQHLCTDKGRKHSFLQRDTVGAHRSASASLVLQTSSCLCRSYTLRTLVSYTLHSAYTCREAKHYSRWMVELTKRVVFLSVWNTHTHTHHLT